MKQVQEIKKLQSQVALLEGEIAAEKMDISNKQKELATKQQNLNALLNKIKSLTQNKKLKVSEHAILRYFERVKGFDLQDIENKILTTHARHLIDKLGGNGTYPTGEGFRIVLKDYTVVTIEYIS